MPRVSQKFLIFRFISKVTDENLIKTSSWLAISKMGYFMVDKGDIRSNSRPMLMQANGKKETGMEKECKLLTLLSIQETS